MLQSSFLWDAIEPPKAVSRDSRNWQKRVAAIYRRMRRAAAEGSYKTTFAGAPLVIDPDVYAPSFFTDSDWFADQLPAIVGTSPFLEIGTGTGALAMVCARRGATVVATDINPAAIANARKNADLAGISLDVRLGDVYSPIEPFEKFDFIFWAHPFNRACRPVSDPLLKSGFDFNYEGVTKFIRDGRSHLTPKGRLLLGTGDSADLGTIFRVAKDAGFHARLLRKAQFPLDVLGGPSITYLLYEFS